MNVGKVIFLNGASSSGKSTIAKLLQPRLEEPFLHMQLDTFIEMLPRIEDALFLQMIPETIFTTKSQRRQELPDSLGAQASRLLRSASGVQPRRLCSQE